MSLEKIKTIVDEATNLKHITNRFGEFDINLEKQIFFFRGLLGMPGYRNFCLAEFPGSVTDTFKVLQSSEDDATAFAVLPLVVNQEGKYPLYDNDDIESVRKELGVEKENLAILLIANFVNIGNKSEIYVNMRAPIVIDADSRAGVQYVFVTEKYDIRFKISE